MNIITVDAGKFQGKGLLNSNGRSFRTKMEKVDKNFKLNNYNDFHVKWNDEYYLIGDGARYVDYDTTKHKLQHKLSTYILCSELLQEINNKDVYLVILSPLSMYVNEKAREEFKYFIFNNGKIRFQLNHNDVNFNIKDITVLGEVCSVPFNNFELFQNTTVGVLDIGGLNVNGLIIKNMSPVRGTEFTVNAGSLIVMEKIRKELNKEIPGANIQEYQMDNIIKQGYYLGDKKYSQEIISTILKTHFKDILQIAKANNWDTKGLNIVCTGGGSLDLGINNIKKYIPQATLSSNPVWDNCIGGKRVGEMLYG